jgi:peptidoglycan hydrolase-like protein with peptidoglycan-binding domain
MSAPMKTTLCLSLMLIMSAALSAADRVALVMGNNRYANLPSTQQLLSPVADAQDVAGALRALGYTLVDDGPITDAGKDAFVTATEKFATLAKNASAAVFYYSGHGVQVGEDNYLLPSDAPRLTGISVLKNRTVLLRDSVMVALEEAGAKTKVIILDCCRDNPFAAQLDAALTGTTKGVKTKSVGEISGYGPGFYLAFATSPGFTANDGNGRRNSPFTDAMIKAMPAGAAKDIDFFFRDVKALLGDDQVSWTNHSLRAAFALAVGPVPTLPSPIATAILPAPAPVPAMANPNGDIFSGSPYADYNNHTREIITRRLQSKLDDLGFDAGVADGKPGKATRQALMDYQRSLNMPITGALDDPTLRSLNLEGIAEERPPVVATRPVERPASANNDSRSKPVVAPRSPTLMKPTKSMQSESLDEKFRRAAEQFEKKK